MTGQDTTAIVKFHRALLDDLHVGTFGKSGIVPFLNPTAQVADAPTRSFITDESGKKSAVLFVSNGVNPQLVGRSVKNGIEAKKVLGSDLGSVILDPIAHGIYKNLSYSIWPLQREISSNLIVGRLQKRFVVPRIFYWLEGAARQTLCRPLNTEMKEAIYVQPLSAFCKISRYPDQLRQLALQALHAVQKENLQPITLLQHSDLWLGNILLPRNRAAFLRKRYAFYVIDWSGAAVNGVPFFDLIRFAASMRLSKASLKRLVSRHCQLLNCEVADAKLYLMVALANVARKLEHFPESRFLDMCNQTVDLLQGIN